MYAAICVVPRRRVCRAIGRSPRRARRLVPCLRHGGLPHRHQRDLHAEYQLHERDGIVCRCVDCRPNAALCSIAPPSWYCPMPETAAGCPPTTEPNFGAACGVEGAVCTYFSFMCGQQARVCSHGVWAPGQAIGCPMSSRRAKKDIRYLSPDRDPGDSGADTAAAPGHVRVQGASLCGSSPLGIHHRGQSDGARGRSRWRPGRPLRLHEHAAGDDAGTAASRSRP